MRRSSSSRDIQGPCKSHHLQAFSYLRTYRTWHALLERRLVHAAGFREASEEDGLREAGELRRTTYGKRESVVGRLPLWKHHGHTLISYKLLSEDLSGEGSCLSYLRLGQIFAQSPYQRQHPSPHPHFQHRRRERERERTMAWHTMAWHTMVIPNLWLTVPKPPRCRREWICWKGSPLAPDFPSRNILVVRISVALSLMPA
ncbi:hypothetical protein BX600DRAFT_14640 [Xylariales sp. PMI_506]|nr:hypothetical protein BX600DRAFT_14640 [Xylariales sp. PMI_506]